MHASFLDSNVVLYSLDQNDAKQRRALELLTALGLLAALLFDLLFLPALLVVLTRIRRPGFLVPGGRAKAKL